MKNKIAIIGCGRISFKHLEAIKHNHDELELIAVCDVIKDRAEEKKSEHLKDFPDAKVSVYTDYKEMLKLKPDIVAIATESGYHPDIAVAALDAGINVIVEKPMALSMKDAERMNAASRRNKRKLAVCFQNRFNAPVQLAYQACQDGRFTRMLHGMVQIRWNRNENYYSQAPWRGTWDLDGGTLMNQCTHGIDLLQWLMGEDAVRVHGVTRRYLRPIEAEDFGSAIIEFKSGAVGMIEGSADIYPKNLNETLSLFGESGSVVIGGLAVNKMETWRFADSEIKGDPENTIVDHDLANPPSVYGFGHTPLYKDFVDAVREDREPFISGEAGSKALEIILAIYKSMKEKRPVDLPLDFSTSEMKGIFK